MQFSFRVDIDPNDSLLGYSLNDEQRKAKAADVPGKYWNGRKGAHATVIQLLTTCTCLTIEILRSDSGA